MIGNDIEITILEIKGDQVKLGINAPNLFIYRKRYIYNQESNKEALDVS